MKKRTVNEITLNSTYWASVSGGKDSWYMLNVILNNPVKYPLNGIVYFDLDIDYPFIKEVINLMKKRVEPLGIPFLCIKPRKAWNELYNKYGYPTRVARWCNSKYKLDCKSQLTEWERAKGNQVHFYIGYCVDEVKRYEKRNKSNEIYPLVEEKIEEKYILEWARKQEIYNDYYVYNDRCGCVGCPMASMKNEIYNYLYYNDLWLECMKKAMETEKIREKELGRPFSVWNSNPKYNTEYRMKRVAELAKMLKGEQTK